MGLDHAELAAQVGRASAPIRAPDAVSKSDLRHWCEVIGDADPSYAGAIKRGEKTAPPTMLMVWAMEPLWPPRGEGSEPHQRVGALFDRAGYSGALGVKLAGSFRRPVRIGDRLHFTVEVLGISPDEEQTPLGTGYRVQLLYSFVDGNGEPVGEQELTVLRFRTLDPPDRDAGPEEVEVR